MLFLFELFGAVFLFLVWERRSHTSFLSLQPWVGGKHFSEENVKQLLQITMRAKESKKPIDIFQITALLTLHNAIEGFRLM